MLKDLHTIDEALSTFQDFKRILLLDGALLVEALLLTFQNGFDFDVDAREEYREDLKILDPDGKPMIFLEIKGMNGGVKRVHVNQADSHRERAGLPSDFPSILIINTHI